MEKKYFHKPSTITFATGGSIKYSYTAGGAKVQELITDTAGDQKQTDYVGHFIYRNDGLKYGLTGVGRTVWHNDSVKEEYFVKDHLGNIRSIVDVHHYPMLWYLATYEIASAQLEEYFFDDLSEVRADKPGSTVPSDTKAAVLNGNDLDRRVGTSILLKVMAGDKVKINADNYYTDYNPSQDEPVNADAMLESLITTLTGGVGGLGSSESHNPDIVPKLFNPDHYAQMNDLMHSNVDSTRLRAFLNYVLFDKNMQVVGSFTGAWQVNGNGSWQPMGTGNNAMTIPVNGYLVVYISNASMQADEGNSDVWFDHISIKISKGHLREEKHYYPYGLPMSGIGASDLRQNPNRRRYQSNEYIKAMGLNWMSFGARQYDPQLGRFMSVDPLAAAGGQEMMSPYSAMGDEPVSTTDADGAFAGHFHNRPNSVGRPMLWGAGISTTNDGYTNPGFHPHTGLGAIGSNIRFMEALQLAKIKAFFAAVYAIVKETTGESGEGDGSGTATNLTGDDGQVSKGDGRIDPQSGQNGIITVDNTDQATKHYFEGDGQPVHLGTKTLAALLASKEFKYHNDRIINGKTTRPSGVFSVNLTKTEFYVGHTNVAYSIACADGNCKVIYAFFTMDGYWDPNYIAEYTLGKLGIKKYQPDGMGPNLEFSGGHPYYFIPTIKIYSFKNPGYAPKFFQQ